MEAMGFVSCDTESPVIAVWGISPPDSRELVEVRLAANDAMINPAGIARELTKAALHAGRREFSEKLAALLPRQVTHGF